MTRSCLLIASVTLLGCESASTTASVESPVTEPALAVESPMPESMPKPTPMPAAEPAVSFVHAAKGLPTSGQWKCDPRIVDVDGDGTQEIVALPRLLKGARMFLMQDGLWQDASAGLESDGITCGGGLEVLDLNGDGRNDLIYGCHCKGLYTWLRNAEGGWDKGAEAVWPKYLSDDTANNFMFQGMEDIAVGDVDGDGHADVFTGGSDEGGINMFLGDGTGVNWEWVSEESLPKRGWCTRLMLHDFEGDGDLDLFASYCRGPKVYINDGQGSFTDASLGLPEPPMQGIWWGMEVGDLDSDGMLDIVVANWVNGPEVFFNRAGQWEYGVDPFPEADGGGTGVDLADFDGDGHLDIVFLGRMNKRQMGHARGLFVLRGDGHGHFEYVADSGLPSTGLSGTAGVTAADFDGDGIPDIVAGTGLSVESSRTRPEGPAEVLLAYRTQRDTARVLKD